MKVKLSLLKRAIKQIPYVQELKEGNCCRYFIVKKNPYSYKDHEVMYNTRRNIWSCHCRYMAFGPGKKAEERYCSHCIACQLKVKEKT